MAAITFNAAHQREHVREQFKNVLTALRALLDAFVNNRMRRAAAQAGHARPRRIPEFVETAMIAVQLMSQYPVRRAPIRSTPAVERETPRSGALPADEPVKVKAEFRPLDGDIVNEAIPAFFIGRNTDGFWVARDARERLGGIFLLENSALAFARRNSRPAGCATIFLSERFELDLENNGNPLIAQLGWLKHLAMRGRQRMVAFIGNMTEAVKRR